jgi:2-methylisocitrate lyase-like PEP mutase family enzyme
MGQLEKIKLLRSAISSGQGFILPEVWDAASATIITGANPTAISTSSNAFGIANGYHPHERIAANELLLLAARVIRSVDIPVNVDIGGALGRSPSTLAKMAKAALHFGAAGITTGDGGRAGAHGILPIKTMVERIKAIKAAFIVAGVPAVLSVRSEVFTIGALGISPVEMLRERARSYLDAGIDCIMVPGVQHLPVVQKIATQTPGPLAVSLSLPDAAGFEKYIAAGVSCVSLDSGLLRMLLADLQQKSAKMLAAGNFSPLDEAIDMEEIAAVG